MRYAYAIMLLLFFSPSAATGHVVSDFTLEEGFARSVMRCDAVVVGRLVAQEPNDPLNPDRTSILHIDRHIFGAPEDSSALRIRWTDRDLIYNSPIEGRPILDDKLFGLQLHFFRDVSTIFFLHRTSIDNRYWACWPTMPVRSLKEPDIQGCLSSLDNGILRFSRGSADTAKVERLLAVRRYINELKNEQTE